MSTNKQNKAEQNLLKQIEQLSKIKLKQQIQWLLRSLLVRGRSNLETGFVLPTVAMVSLVVVLLSVALVVRAFDRSKNASNVRVNQVVLNAATPALDRAKAKIDALFADDTLPRATPSDIALNLAFETNPNKYRFGDETRLKLVKDLDSPVDGIQSPTTTTALEDNETIKTAWKYPVDTDNNGLFDSYTLYGIYFRSPTRDATGKFNRQRNPLEARTPPMNGYLGNQCANAVTTTANLVGDSSWYRTGSKLTKSFYVYTATVPITDASLGAGYEPYKGNKGFSALEYQQDRSQIPLNNNAVVFQDDLELTPGPNFNLNGRVFTNANLLIGGRPGDNGNIRLFQVSSPNSCFYQEENAKVTVGGNVGTGNVNDTANQKAVAVDLYDGFGNAPVTGKEINGTNKSTDREGGAQVGYNDTAYTNRIALMKRTALSYSTVNPPTIASVNAVTQYPDKEVKSSFSFKVTANPSLDTLQVLEDVIEVYLRDRTRRVPYAEVATPNAVATGSYTLPTDTAVFASGTIEPPLAWREPTTTNTGLILSATQLEQTDPDKQKKLGKEVLLGDRISVGNNLPAYWKNSLGQFVFGPFERQLLGASVFWNDPADKLRFRTTQVVKLPDLGISDRTGFWEDAAARTPATITSSTGGLRVVTGAGIYVDTEDTATPQNRYFTTLTSLDLSKDSFLRKPQLDTGVTAPLPFTTASITTGNTNIVVWPDTMPMTGGAGETRKGDLQMRATAIYHYKDTSYTDTNYINRTPTACISSYYDPTNSATAKNTAIDGGYGIDAINGRSNNGVVYPSPYATDATRVTAVGTYRGQLNRQARLIFPNGRIVNEPLRNALKKIDASGTRSLVDNSAIDTAICGIRILTDTTFTPNLTPPVAPGAIKESSFLDARQVKALDQSPTSINPVSPNELLADNDTTDNYNLDLEQRQPLEIRATDIDMNLLRTKTIGSATNQEYMLPNSGIIYATREDALLDESAGSLDVPTTSPQFNSQTRLLSPTDFKLDPTRRPNGIRLINGENLARDNNFRAEEKGLILATDLPLYIRGNFNRHRKPGATTLREEFTDTLDDTWSDFYTRTAATLDPDFACRTNQQGCGTDGGDQWRPATIISDATSLISAGFADGFRDLGDYDLRNNAGISATLGNPDTQIRKKNGFWDNSFITNPVYWDTAAATGLPIEAARNSYLTNGVTPVQRRVNFPEYLMEVCTKIPVSTCTPNDWYVNPATLVKAFNVIGQTYDVTAHTAGTTASTIATNRRYARRVAFQRNAISGSLVLTTIGTKSTPIPLGISGTTITALPYPNGSTAVSGTNYPSATNNALWFRTTTSTNGNPDDPASISYAADQPLYYLPPVQGGTKLILPDTLDIPGVSSLNLPAGSQGSNYTVCVGNGSQPGSQAYQPTTPIVSTPLTPSCPSTTANAIDAFFGVGGDYGLIDLPATSPALTAAGGTVNATRDLNVIPLPDSFNNGTTITLNSTNPNAIFVLQANRALSFGSNCNNNDGIGCGAGVTLVLNGVDPNNIFWAVTGAINFENVSAPGHLLSGTFIGKGAISNIGANTKIQGGRILGASNIAKYGTAGVTITAITSTEQPSIVPVLQIHSPGGTPANALDTGGSIVNDWTQQASAATTFNIAFVTGNSPSRPAEESAGLHNFVRFMERWNNTAVNIKGSFIQLRRSAYATAPFSPIRSGATQPAPRANTGANTGATNDGSLSIFNYPNTFYPSGGGPGNTLTFYTAPTRQWGFDVALLTQPPDLFAQRFTQQSTTPPDEFFRQVGKDDPWVQNLLCAAQGSGTAYTAAIGDQRPSSCPALSSYND